MPEYMGRSQHHYAAGHRVRIAVLRAAPLTLSAPPHKSNEITPLFPILRVAIPILRPDGHATSPAGSGRSCKTLFCLTCGRRPGTCLGSVCPGLGHVCPGIRDLMYSSGHTPSILSRRHTSTHRALTQCGFYATSDENIIFFDGMVTPNAVAS